MRGPKKPIFDMDELHRLYMSGASILKMSNDLFIDYGYCSAILKDLRLADPEKWPPRGWRGNTKKKVEVVVEKPKVKIEATYKREPLSAESANSKITYSHINDYPPEEQERMMNLVDPNRKTKPAFGGGWGMLP